jgi:hypothetical protein
MRSTGDYCPDFGRASALQTTYKTVNVLVAAIDNGQLDATLQPAEHLYLQQ